MSQVFKENGEVVPVTVVKAGPCVVTRVKTNGTDGYTAVQVGFEESKRLTKSKLGQVKGLTPLATLREFRVTEEDAAALKRGQVIAAGVFVPGELVKVTGVSKGKGFAGVVKRHHFAGQGTSHGTKDQVRMPGSSGVGGVQHVFKNTRKPGRMGGDQITVSNLEIVKIDPVENLLYIKGAVPGSRDTLIAIANGSALDVNLLTDMNAPAQSLASDVPPVEAPAQPEATVEAPAVSEPVSEAVNS